MPQCSQCKKKSSKAPKRKLGNDGICVECTETNANNANEHEDQEHSDINPDAMLGELSVRAFSAWFKLELDGVIQNKVSDVTKPLVKELNTTKNNLKTAQQEIKDLKGIVESLKTSLKDATTERDELRKTSQNNLKYLINFDRNVRRTNVMIFGVPEKENLVVNQIEASDDETKISALLGQMQVQEKVEVMSYTRIGKPSEGEAEERHRPIKLVLKNSNMASIITANAKLLKPLDKKIFCKPDKTAKEREEFQRLLKKKNECILKHPTDEGGVDRVVLKNGVLTVDGAEVDKYNTPQTIF